jgi:SAM-dependent methyltransferase
VKKYFDQVNTHFKDAKIEIVNECLVCGSWDDYGDSDARIQIVNCKECGFIWNRKQPTQEALDKFYEQSEAMDTWAEIKQTEEEKVRQIEKYDCIWDYIIEKNIHSVLDVGCGNGFFLNRAQCKDKVGIEVNSAAKLHCKFPVYPGIDQFKESMHAAKKYDMITLFGVLEHLKRPYDEIERYEKFLSEHGVFCIIVPNVSSLVVKTLREECCTFCPQHLYYFDIHTLTWFFENMQYKLDGYTTIEPELQPILRKLRGYHPYERIGVELTDKDITERKIIESNNGYKAISFFKRSE